MCACGCVRSRGDGKQGGTRIRGEAHAGKRPSKGLAHATLPGSVKRAQSTVMLQKVAERDSSWCTQINTWTTSRYFQVIRDGRS